MATVSLVSSKQDEHEEVIASFAIFVDEMWYYVSVVVIRDNLHNYD